MRAVIQRVSGASVTVDGVTVGEIRSGMLLLVGVASSDSKTDVDALVAKVVGLRIFADDEGKMNRSLSDAGGSVLVVSQFTLQADIRRGRRPSFTSAAQPAKAEPLIERVCEGLRSLGLSVAEGQFGANMEVALVNDGPVTIVFDTVNGQVV